MQGGLSSFERFSLLPLDVTQRSIKDFDPLMRTNAMWALSFESFSILCFDVYWEFNEDSPWRFCPTDEVQWEVDYLFWDFSHSSLLTLTGHWRLSMKMLTNWWDSMQGGLSLFRVLSSLPFDTHREVFEAFSFLTHWWGLIQLGSLFESFLSTLPLIWRCWYKIWSIIKVWES